MRPLGLPLDLPQVVASRVLSDLGAIAGAARMAPTQLNRLIELGEELVGIGESVVQLAERLDARAARVIALGELLDARANEMLALGERMSSLGEQMDARGAEIVDRASGVVQTGTELIAVLPTLERAIAMATPLEGAIDRFGRLVDRLPGGAARQRGEPGSSDQPA